MTKKDMMELKKRLKKDDVTFTKICGCYVDGEHNKVLKIDERFLTLEEDVLYKYLEIAKKTLTGKIGDNLITTEFPTEEENTGGKQQFLMGLKSSALKNEDMLDVFYDLIIENYEYVGNYLILVFHDAYDVMTKTSDGRKLDESDEVYEYIICSICPVKLSKPGLGYLSDVNEIGPRIRDWVVDAPESGFVFPDFSDRSSDIHSMTFYTKNAKEPHYELWENAFNCPVKKTTSIKREAFENIIAESLDCDESEAIETYLSIQESVREKVEETIEDSVPESESVLTTADVKEIITNAGVPEEKMNIIVDSFEEEFTDEPPKLGDIYNEKALKKNEDLKEKIELQNQVKDLKKQIENCKTSTGETSEKINTDANLRIESDMDINPEIREIDGKKFLMVPISETTTISVDGNLFM